MALKKIKNVSVIQEAWWSFCLLLFSNYTFQDPPMGHCSVNPASIKPLDPNVSLVSVVVVAVSVSALSAFLLVVSRSGMLVLLVVVLFVILVSVFTS